MRAGHVSPFGAQYRPGAGTSFRFWAPSQAVVQLQLGSGQGRRLPMQKQANGWHEATVADADAGEGSRYGFVCADGTTVPDPASRSNPDDVHGLSQIVDPLAYEWQDGSWRGRPWHEAVIYELHVGTFTDEGNFAAAARRLGDLADLGITAIELMPVADFPGRRNWGYDGVLMYAPDASYGTPAELKGFVDAAHALGLMVFLDVVYNHFGPDGNYLHGYCPEFFNPRHQTPWGAAINFDGPQRDAVRAFYVHNALHWTSEYRFDGLRLDAVHAIADDSEQHIVMEIAAALRNGPGRERHIHLILENERNQATLLRHRHDPEAAGASAQWNDDLHHAAHVLLSGESDSYYADYADRPADRLARALAEGFVYQGQASAFRNGQAHGESSRDLPTSAFVSFLQNHDQIGNRAFGERLQRLTDIARLDAAYACLLLSPHVPMLFMGEEFAASTPFLYFCDFAGELAQAVSKGRRAEFAKFAAFSDPAARQRIPDPVAVGTFEASRLRWSEQGQGEHGKRQALIRHLLEIRRLVLVPLLGSDVPTGTFSASDGHFSVEWTLGDGSQWLMRANFGDHSVAMALPPDAHAAFKSEAVRKIVGGSDVDLAPNTVWVGRSMR
jgi:maltooligosyltrehalose trehalohydrolase